MVKLDKLKDRSTKIKEGRTIGIRNLKYLFMSNIKQYTMLMALILIVIVFQYTTNGVLLRPINVSNLVQQNSYILIMAIGMLLVILTGNIDLSVGSVAGFVGAVSAVMIVQWKWGTVETIIISLMIGALIGAWQGFWIAYVRIPAFIVTLAGQLIFRGLTMVILKGMTLAPFTPGYTMMAAGFLPDFFGNDGLHLTTMLFGVVTALLMVISDLNKRRQLRKHNFEMISMPLFIFKEAAISLSIIWISYILAQYKGLPIVLILLGFLVVLFTFITQKTTIGRHIYAFGGNEKAAKLSGIKTSRVFFWVYVNMSVLAALAGIVFAGRLNAATPKAGGNFELDAIAACYIGGASASGGIGTVVGAIIGGLIMGILNNGMSIMSVSIDWQQAIKGFVLLAAVAFDVYSKRKTA